MRRLPGAVFVIDPQRERIAVTEARKLEIPVIAHRRHQRRPDAASTTSSPPTTTPSGPSGCCAGSSRTPPSRASASEPSARPPSRRCGAEVSEAEEASDEVMAAIAAGGTYSFAPEPDEDEDALLPGAEAPTPIRGGRGRPPDRGEAPPADERTEDRGAADRRRRHRHEKKG